MGNAHYAEVAGGSGLLSIRYLVETHSQWEHVKHHRHFWIGVDFLSSVTKIHNYLDLWCFHTWIVVKQK